MHAVWFPTAYDGTSHLQHCLLFLPCHGGLHLQLGVERNHLFFEVLGFCQSCEKSNWERAHVLHISCWLPVIEFSDNDRTPSKDMGRLQLPVFLWSLCILSIQSGFSHFFITYHDYFARSLISLTFFPRPEVPLLAAASGPTHISLRDSLKFHLPHKLFPVALSFLVLPNVMLTLPHILVLVT